jgi:DNA primase
MSMDSVEEVKSKTNIANLVGEYVTLKKMGRNLKGLCPFHGEKTPSFMVNEELGIYKCFGCGAGGDVFNFLMAIEGLDFGEALHKLADKAGVKLPEFKNSETDVKKELIAVNTMAAEYFHYLLTKHEAGEEARKYLKDRKINEKLWETFKIGFSLPEWDGLSKYLVNKKGYRGDLLVAAGLAIEGGRGVYDRFRGRIMFPLLDSAGRIVGFSGRILPELATGDEGKYINSPETEIYHKGRMLYGFSNARSAIKKANRVILVEGQLDTISSYGAGISETVGVGGTALTIEMVEMLGKVAQEVILALDNDPAGEAAMKRSIDLIEKRGMSIKMVEIDGGKDPDEIARNFPGKWKEMVNKAVPVYEFFFNRMVAKYGTDSVESIGKIVREIVPMLASIDNSVIREVWVRRLALKIGVDKQGIEEEMEKVRRNQRSAVSGQRSAVSEKTVDKDREFLGAVITAKESWRIELKKMFLGLPPVGAVGKLLVEILNRESLDLSELKKDLPEELFTVLSESVLVIDEELSEKDFFKQAAEWGKRVVKEEKSRLTDEIRIAEKDGQIEKIDNLMGKLVKLNAIEKRLDQS